MPMSIAEVKCLHTQMCQTSSILEHPRNPNRHPEAQIELLAQIIKVRGWRSPIVVSKRSGYVVKGHGRLAAARAAGLTECPVELQDYSTDAEEIADMIADNRIAELSEVDSHMLRELLAQMPPGDASRMLLGFTDEEFMALLAGSFISEAKPKVVRPPKNVGKVLRFGTSAVAATDLEYEELTKRAAAYVESNGTSYGFARHLLKMP